MTNFDKKPAILESVGNGSYFYRFNIREHVSDDEAMPDTFDADEVVVWSPITANKITEAVIGYLWPPNYEQKLINEYNAAQIGQYGSLLDSEAQNKVNAYRTFLQERAAIKAHIDADCAALGIK